MSQTMTLARPYARAAFAAASGAGQVASWSQALALAARLAADPKVEALLKHPQLSTAEAASLLAVDGAGEDFGRFIELLASNRRLPLLAEIAGMFEQLRAEAEHVVKARVTSASEMPAAELESIRVGLKRRFGREVELETAIDESLIGGAVIDAGDVVIDGSLKSKLSRMQSALAG
ncbi:F0F1 ATP synthase subunit delta [Lysobacter ciconiae]|uniref:ATP synthase subunit delta n=1 Tax=Novilysobacter ciconiae TaxID=2781022 RepID=A0A7S6UFA4_9GAMM|nr:F0F1 ATP synthase subunit delta [Lysobacter ciconiae]QOW19240.1 F0F1 ATP synthase subunit delta [Lysobacter ciconiae]